MVHRLRRPRTRTTPRRAATTRVAVAALAVAGSAFLAIDRVGLGVRHEAPHVVALIRFYGGVCTLVALSLSVAAGLLASERVLLGARRRVWVQSAHRTLALLAMPFLVIHLVTEITAHRIGPVAAAVPFVTTSLYLGLGSVAAYLMMAVTWTGLIRARFAGAGRPGMWRVLHVGGYLCWPIALLHGLHAGRHPAVWVTASYLLLLVLVTLAAGLRLAAERRRRRARAVRLEPGLRHPASVPARPPIIEPAAMPHRRPSDPRAVRGELVEPQRRPSDPRAVRGELVEPQRRPPEPRVPRRDLPGPPPDAPAAHPGSPPWADLPTVVDLDTRRRARRDGAPTSSRRRRGDVLDEADERYLAALRGEAR